MEVLNPDPGACDPVVCLMPFQYSPVMAPAPLKVAITLLGSPKRLGTWVTERVVSVLKGWLLSVSLAMSRVALSDEMDPAAAQHLSTVVSTAYRPVP